VFSEDRERNAKDGTDKAQVAHKQVISAALKKVKALVLHGPAPRYDDSYYELERCFRLRREADMDSYQHRLTQPKGWWSYEVEFLSQTALDTLRNIAQRLDVHLHKQALTTLSKGGLIKPFRKAWRVTQNGERALKYHAEKDAFYRNHKSG
jgi:hypothetical protein